MAAMNANPEVMRYFPSLVSQEDTWLFIERMQAQLIQAGFCYYAVDLLDTQEFIGFIGLSIPKFESDFTPCVDIGWRLAPVCWNQGLASEGAARCLEHAKDLGIAQVLAIAPQVNLPSIQVMRKIGMQHIKNFEHPLLKDYPSLQNCVLYGVKYN